MNIWNCPNRKGMATEKHKVPLFRMFRRNKSGATAVEFGLVAVPFIFLLMSILEVGLHFFTTLDIEFAVEESARLVRTGQSQGDSADQFKTKVCSKVSVLTGCSSNLKIEIQSFDNFEAMREYMEDSASEPEDVDDQGNPTGELKSSFPFDQGAGGSVVLVRAFYVWEDYSLIPGFGPSELGGSGLGKMANGDKLIQAATTFRNEPF